MSTVITAEQNRIVLRLTYGGEMNRLTHKSNESDMVWFIDNENNNMFLEPCEMNSHHNRLAIQKLEKYESEEENGLLLRLPIPQGTKVYVINYTFECKYNYECPLSFDKNKCEEDFSCKHEYKVYRVKEIKFDYTMLDKIGKTVFLTEEEAKQHLPK